MQIIQTPLAGLVMIEPVVAADERGSFFEAWQAQRYDHHGLPGRFVQCNVSTSRRGVLRGLHLQHPSPQSKLVGVAHGSVYDVAVDVRRGSPTFGRWFGTTLSADSARQVIVPEGFAHGFIALSDAVVVYLVTTLYDPASEIVIRWDDSDLAIQWPIQPEILSGRDRNGLRLAELADRLPLLSG